MQRLIPAAVLALALLGPTAMTVAAQSSYSSNAQHALQWLQCTQQQPNGQIGNGGNPIARSSEVALGLAAAGLSASAMRSGATSLADYLKTAVSTDVGTNGELLLARASQKGAGSTATVAAQLQASKSTTGATAGEYGSDIFPDALAILGLRAAGQLVGQDAVAFLQGQQKSDGGWSADNADAYGTDSNTTALVIQALISSGVATTDSSIASGFGYLQSVFGQGGFENSPGSAPDPNSNELAIQAIRAANRQGDAAWATMLNQALRYLAGEQIASGANAGAIANSYSKLFATTYAPAAFLLRPLTEIGLADGQVSLLPCVATSAATPASHPTQAAVALLARTGAPTDDRPMAAGLLVLLLGIAFMARSRGRVPRS
ncbi:MAG: hypothetical protein M3077_08000 [Candidatus Dormibacteraeota bacterium]|nr:hypothetical protein [Candidatus Dormibacteraeota bacterium]